MPDGTLPISVVTSPGEWRGDALQNRTDRWLYELSGAEIGALRKAGAALVASRRSLSAVTAQEAAESLGLDQTIRNWRERLASGLGVVLVRGLPVGEMGKAEAAAAFWLLGLGLGAPVPQNAASETLVDIRDTGASPKDHNTRLYKTRAELSFHTDGADIIGLLCLRAAKSGGVSRICSSVYVYNEVVRRAPHLAPLIHATYHHHAHGQFGPNGPKTFQYPIASRVGGTFRMLLLLWYIRNAAHDFPEFASLTKEQEELLDLLEAIPLEPGVALDMSFQEGDMQFLKNAVILHARTEYEDWEDEDRKRHLLRLWLSAPDFKDGDDRLREGISGENRR